MKVLTFAALVGTTLLLFGCGFRGEPADGASADAPAATATVTPTVEPVMEPEEALLKAYAHYWQVYAESLLNLDKSQLVEVMTGPRLEQGLDEIEKLRGRDRAVRTVVESHPLVVKIAADRAVLVDDYDSRSYLVDPVSKTAPREPDQVEKFRDIVTLVRVGTTWKVFETVEVVGQR